MTPPSFSGSGINATLCSTCSKHTLQSLHRGTDNHPLSGDRDLCRLIRNSLNSSPELFDSNDSLQITLRVDFKEKRFETIVVEGIAKHNACYRLKECTQTRAGSSQQHTFSRDAKTPPIRLLTAYNSLGKRMTKIKATPLHGTDQNFELFCARRTIPVAGSRSAGGH